ncbi:hypothetical protein ACFTAO_04840 [Paenibacillus rhizoplanae]
MLKTVTPSKAAGHQGAIGFTVDTKAPALLLDEDVQTSLDKENVDNTVSNQVVFLLAQTQATASVV